MTARTPVKISKLRARLVGVIASRADLQLAVKMANPPDFFELRLDRLIGCLDQLEKKRLPAPLIITARHPAEGGANRLSIQRRRDLLMRFLPRARYVDLELRSAKSLRVVLDLARKKRIGSIISFHDFKNTPSVRTLKNKARAAKSYGADIFKVAIRTDTSAQVERLLDFFANEKLVPSGAKRKSFPEWSRKGRMDIDLAISAMGMGKLGAVSRVVLAQLGSVLNYGSLRTPNAGGQLSIRQLRSALCALKII
jgi:3-dehydroquinate dehydratase-1